MQFSYTRQLSNGFNTDTSVFTTLTKKDLPTHYLLPDDIGLKYPSMVMLEQIFTIDKTRLIKWITRLDKYNMHRIEMQIRRSFDMRNRKTRRTRYGRERPAKTD